LVNFSAVLLLFSIVYQKKYIVSEYVKVPIMFVDIFRKWGVRVWTGSSWLRIWTGAGTCECGNEPSGSIKCGEFLD
jgi:hypothetical protein